jgi:DegV family protein with EDD domain
MGLGLVAIAAARLAKEGARLPQLVAATKTFTRNIYVWALFDTLKYLALGGRIGKAQALMGSLLNIKPLLAVKTGEMVPVTRLVTAKKGWT